MSHNLFGERFGDQRKPAWHELGQVFEKPLSATAAYRKLGPYEVRLAPCVADGTPLNNQAILRNPTTDDPETRVFGIVGKDYHLITPDEFCAIWDERVARPVETIGALGYGETFFISTYLPKVSVRGDDVEFYLLGKNAMTGLHAAEMYTTGVRVVCQNTLSMAESAATSRFKVVHDHTAKQRIGDWLQEVYEEAETTARVLTEMYDALAGRKVKDAEAKELFEVSYPYPRIPKTQAPSAVMEQRVKWWQENVNLMDRRREGARSLFEGLGTGMDSKAAKGTLWGAYNAVVETEDYRRGRDNTQIAESVLFGERMQAKRRAFTEAMKMVKA